mmetsp:Transcript_825/g.1984  ORF Transcript_825/g.1984 Transcript_825/m.1984 type:complete len:376 (-) Transcript_825:1300-2427(-)
MFWWGRETFCNVPLSPRRDFNAWFLGCTTHATEEPCGEGDTERCGQQWKSAGTPREKGQLLEILSQCAVLTQHFCAWVDDDQFELLRAPIGRPRRPERKKGTAHQPRGFTRTRMPNAKHSPRKQSSHGRGVCRGERRRSAASSEAGDCRGCRNGRPRKNLRACPRDASHPRHVPHVRTSEGVPQIPRRSHGGGAAQGTEPLPRAAAAARERLSPPSPAGRQGRGSAQSLRVTSVLRRVATWPSTARMNLKRSASDSSVEAMSGSPIGSSISTVCSWLAGASPQKRTPTPAARMRWYMRVIGRLSGWWEEVKIATPRLCATCARAQSSSDERPSPWVVSTTVMATSARAASPGWHTYLPTAIPCVPVPMAHAKCRS